MNRITEEHATEQTALAHREAKTTDRGSERMAAEESWGRLLPADAVQEFRTRWDRVQTAFVDDPQTAVKQADELVSQAVKRLADTFSEQRSGLERQWAQGGDVSTEDLRVALRKYRAFFQRLLAAGASGG